MDDLPRISDIDDADPDCQSCGGTGWVCENHPEQIGHKCELCGGAAMPCFCNPLASHGQVIH